MSLETNPAETSKESEIKTTLARVRENTSDEEHGGVVLFEEAETPAQKRANEIYDSLNLTLEEIAEEAAAKALSGSQAREAEIVLSEILDASSVTKAFSKGEIEFEHDFEHEQKAAAKGDKIYSYKAKGALIGLREYDLELMIRPRTFEKLADIGRNLEFAEDRDQRMSLTIRPKFSKGSDISVRIDPNEEIEFDIETDWIDLMDLSGAGQIAGHHFPSGLKYADARASFADVMEAINSKVKVRSGETKKAA